MPPTLRFVIPICGQNEAQITILPRTWEDFEQIREDSAQIREDFARSLLESAQSLLESAQSLPESVARWQSGLQFWSRWADFGRDFCWLDAFEDSVEFPLGCTVEACMWLKHSKYCARLTSVSF